MQSIRRLATLTVPLVTFVIFAALARLPGAMTAPPKAMAQAAAAAEAPHDLCSRLLCE